jgi:hypothetical protein
MSWIKSQYQKQRPLYQRTAEFSSLHEKHPDRRCVVFDVPKDLKLKKYKFLTPREMTLGQLLVIIRKNIDTLPSSTALFVFTESNTIVSPSATVEKLFSSFKSEDGALYLFLRKENTFGGEN